jgi:23S rRNA pseudouridine1911/1915/1917 synthase
LKRQRYVYTYRGNPKILKRRRRTRAAHRAVSIHAMASPMKAKEKLDVRAAGALDLHVDTEAAGQRLDRYLSHAAVEAGLALSRTRLKALIEAGEVSLGGSPASDPAAKVGAGDHIIVSVPEPEPSTLSGEHIPLAIVFEDDHLVIIDKPAGLVVHPAAGHAEGTLVHALIAHCGDSLSGVGGVRRPGIVHRLDKDTSGLLVVAKTDAAHHGLAELFADHGRSGSLVREYVALVWGALERKAGVIDAPIARHPRQREKMAIAAEHRGRHAVTHWRVDRALGSASLITCRLETGRTHQIRVHLAHIGHPLLGDSVYGAGFKSKASRLPEAARAALATLDRQALHAGKLGFVHPITGESLRFESPPPDDLAQLLRALDTSVA